jgi:hypothetical protein
MGFLLRSMTPGPAAIHGRTFVYVNVSTPGLVCPWRKGSCIQSKPSGAGRHARSIKSRRHWHQLQRLSNCHGLGHKPRSTPICIANAELRSTPFAALLARGSSGPNKQPGFMGSHARCCDAHRYSEQSTQQHAFTRNLSKYLDG